MLIDNIFDYDEGEGEGHGREDGEGIEEEVEEGEEELDAELGENNSVMDNYKKARMDGITQRQAISRSQAVIGVNLTTGLKVKYSSQTTAAATVGILHNLISRCCLGLRANAGGFSWQYASGKIFYV